MALEKERHIMYAIMIVGVILLALGLVVYFFINSKIPGALLVVFGVAVFMIGMSIQNMFYRLDMHEVFSNPKKKS